jgi:hypothetical protein
VSDFKTLGRAAVLLSAFLAGGSICAADSPSPAAPAQTPGAAPAAQPLTWPRVFQEGAETLTMYQPQIEKWDDTTITFRAAIAVEPAEGAEPVYGMVRTTAQADVDKAARIVTLHDFQIVKVSFPTAPERDVSYLAILSRQLPTHAKEISLDRLEASLAVSEAVKKQRGLAVNNDPPRIFFSTHPALLVLVDGDPVLRPFGDAERVINTRALIVKDGDAFYLSALNFWYQAPEIAGPWTPLAQPPGFLAQMRQAAGDQVDLIAPETDAAPPAAPPALFVSTVPAELIQTDGAPQFVPIADTALLQAQNSDDAIFLDGQTGDYFVLISGRWFKSASLEGEPWRFASAKELPADFARIPADNPRANVLASVAGTPEAHEALIADAIPQTAAVTPGPAELNLLYDGAPDGAPQFEPVEGVPDLQYAANASLPVIESAPASFYCVQNGVWFVAPTAAGPWTVATAVPPAIYAIPPSCPLHYVTYCRIYGFTPEAVFVGYMPGYLGAVISADGVVVYGTGYRYRRHVGLVWIPQPCTYGFGAGFACGPDTGFEFGFAGDTFAGGCLAPYWGPFDWGWRHHFNYGRISVNHVDLYSHWGGKVVSIRQRPPHAGEEENARLHPQAPFNPYSARPAAIQRAPAEHQPAAKSVKLDWSANAKPRPKIPTSASATTEANRRAQVTRLNNVFVSASGEVYRRAPAPEPAARPAPVENTRETPTRARLPGAAQRETPTPAREPAEAQREAPTPARQPAEARREAPPPARQPAEARREAPTPAREPAQPAQWEQHTASGWKPAAQSPAFREAAPELNREAAARDIGETRAVSRPARVEAPPSIPAAPPRPSAPTPGGAPRR